MQNIHPLIVHFPIALLISALVFEILGQFLKKETLLEAAKWNLWLGTLAAGAAVGSGLWAEEHVAHNDAAHAVMELHEELGWVVLGGAALLSLWKWKAKAEWEAKARPFLLLFQVILISVLATGAHQGGRLVYEFGVGTQITAAQETAAVPAEASEDLHGHPGHEHSHAAAGAAASYFCPMKCEGSKTYDKPGKCPVCGMRLDTKS